ncbi:MAG: hypothetical protein ACC628_07870, partial [Pirellulaceae bacterium]
CLPNAAEGRDLYLAGGGDRQLWRFQWSSQQWKSLTDESKSPVRGVTALAVAADRVYALAGASGWLYSTSATATTCQVESENIKSVRAVGDILTVCDARGGVRLLERGEWQQPFGKAAHPASEDDLPRYASDTKFGLVLAGREWSAVLSPSLALWQPVQAGFQVDRLYGLPDKSSVWATSREGQLGTLTADGDGWQWLPIDFSGEESPVASATMGSGPNNDRHWVCLANSSVYSLENQLAKAWRKSSSAPGGPEDVVGVAPSRPGFLVAFRDGKLGRYEPSLAVWSAVKGPEGSGIQRFLHVGSEDARSAYWILATDGKLHYASATDLAWKLVAQDVSEIAAAGSRLLAASQEQGRLQQFDSSANGSDIVAGSRLPGAPVPEIRAAGEVQAADGRSILVISDGERLLAYDPKNRRWTEQPLKMVKLVRAGTALVGRSASGEAVFVKWNAGQLQTQPIPFPAKVVDVAGSASGQKLLATLEDGRLVLLDERQRLLELMGSQIPAAHRSLRVIAAAASGDRVFIALSGGPLYMYESRKRRWQQIAPNVAGVRRLHVRGGVLWIESEMNGTRQLLSLDEQGGRWQGRRVLAGIHGWHPAADGIVAHVAQGGGLMPHYVSATGASFDLNVAPAEGPEEPSVTAIRSTPHGVWMNTSDGRLWNYRPKTRVWQRCELDGAVNSAVLDSQLPVVLTDKQSLQFGSPQPAGGWIFREVAAGVRPYYYDAVGQSLAVVTGGSLTAWKLQQGQAQPVAQHRLTSAWPDNRKIQAALGVGTRLFVASNAQELSMYDLTTRQWDRYPNLPWSVQDLFWSAGTLHSVGAGGELAALQGDRWQLAGAKAGGTWQHNRVQYRIGDTYDLQTGSARATTSTTGTLPNAAPIRIHSEKQHLWIELEDGSLWRYDEQAHKLALEIPRRDGQTSRDGLVTIGRHTYFVALQAGKVALLGNGGSAVTWLELPKDRPYVRLLRSADRLILSAADQAVLVQGTSIEKVTSADQAKALAAEGKPLASDRLQQSGEWKINGSATQRHLSRKYGDTWQDVPIDRTYSRLAWDVVLGGMSWRDR